MPSSTDPKPAARPSPAPKPVDVASRTKDLLQTAPQVSLPKGGGAHRGMGETVRANPTAEDRPFLRLGRRQRSLRPGLAPRRAGDPAAHGSRHAAVPGRRREDTFVMSEAEELVPWLDLVEGAWTRIERWTHPETGRCGREMRRRPPTR